MPLVNWWKIVAYTRECEGCGKTFVAQRSDKRFCARNCKDRLRNRYKTNAGKHKWAHIKRLYGLTEASWNALFDLQGRACASCGDDDSPKWCVDHCHETGAIRGILCNQCNVALGMLRDNAARVAQLLIYIEQTSEVELG